MLWRELAVFSHVVKAIGEEGPLCSTNEGLHGGLVFVSRQSADVRLGPVGKMASKDLAPGRVHPAGT